MKQTIHTTMTPRHLTLTIAGLLLLVLAALPARAALDTWSGLSVTSSNWNDGGNWVETTPPSPGDSLDFTGSSAVVDTNNFANGIDFGSITFDGSASAFTLWGNTAVLSGNTNGSSGVTNNSGQTQTINLNLTGDWGFLNIASPSGTLYLDDTMTNEIGGVIKFDGSGNVYSTTFSLDPTGLISGLGGAATIGTSGATGAGAGVSFAGLATLSGGSPDQVFQYAYSAGQQFASGTSAVLAVAIGATTQSAAANIELTASGGAAATVYNSLAGGTSTTYGANNTYINTILVANANAGTKYIIGLGGNANGGTLVLGSTNYGTGMYLGGIYAPNLGTAQGLTICDGSSSWITCGPMSGNPVPGEIILDIDGSNTSNEAEHNGVIKDNLSGGAVTVVKTGAGSMYFNTTNGYSGGTYIDQGYLQINNSTGLGKGPVYIAGGAELYLQTGTGNYTNNFYMSPGAGVSYSQLGAIKIGNGSTSITIYGTVNLMGAPVTSGPGDRFGCSGSGGAVTLAGQLTGTGTLDIYPDAGSGDNVSFYLSNNTANANNWTGGVLLDPASNEQLYFKMDAPNQLNGNNIIFVQNGNTCRFDLNGNNSQVVGGLSSGTSTSANNVVGDFNGSTPTLTVGSGNASAFFGGLVGGGGNTFSIIKTGSGTQSFGGTVAYTGSTTVNGGILWMTNSANLETSSSITVNTTGTLNMTNVSPFVMSANQTFYIDGGTLDMGGLTAGSGTSAFSMNGGSVTMGAVTGTFNAVNLTNGTIDLSTISASGSVFETVNYSTSGTTTYNISSLPPIVTYPTTFVLVQFSSISGSGTTTATLPVESPVYDYSVVTTSSEVQLVITGGPTPVRQLTWLGGISDGNTAPNGGPEADWDLTTDNWTTGSGTTHFNQNDEVIFNDLATDTNVNITYQSPPLSPDSMTVNNNLLAYYFTGSGGLTGPATLVKTGTNSLVVANSGANNFTGGVYAGGGTLVLQDQSDAIGGNLVATNGGQAVPTTVILDDNSSPGNAMTGTTTIYSNSAVQIANNDGNGILPAGSVLINSGGSLVFDNSTGNPVVVANPISGTGTIIQNNANGITQIDAANTGFNGSALVDQGTLQFGVINALNATVPITIANGATLDVNGIAGTNTVAAVSGSGVNGNGAIVNNSGTTAYPAISYITLTGDTTFGGSAAGRWDLRSEGGTAGNPAQCKLICAGGTPYSITKIGGNFMGIVACTVDPNLLNIDVQNGTLDIEGNTTGLGNPAGTLSVEGPGILFFYEPTNYLNKNFVFNDDSTVNQNNGATVVAGPVTLTGTSFGTTVETTGGTSLTFSNAISGIGDLVLKTTATGTVPVILAGTNTFSGTTTIVSGEVELVGKGSINNTAINILQGSGTLDVSQLTIAFSNANSLFLDGILSLGNTPVTNFSSLDLDSGTLNLAFNNPAVAPMAVTNLIVGSTVINITALPITLTPGTYPMILIQGGSLPGNAPNVTLPPGYGGQLVVDILNNSIDLQITSVTLDVWNSGAGAGEAFWSLAANWDGNNVGGGSPLYFGTGSSLNTTNDTTADTQYASITFAPGAPSFTLNGNPIELSGAIANQASNPETVSVELDYSGSTFLYGGSSSAAPLIMGGELNNSGSAASLYLNGYGILSNNFVSAGTGNAFLLTNNSANWTLADGTNATPSTPVTLSWGFLIWGGTFNFGTATSAPVFSSTAANGTVGSFLDDNVVGYETGGVGTFNMVNGSLTLAARLDTGGSVAGATGIINQTGGTLTVNGQFQGANVASGISTVTLSGGALNIPGGTTFVASRGTGSLTVGGTAVATLTTLDVSRGIGTTVGTVNLNGGTLQANQVSTATANVSAPAGSANFNFNGGTLKAGASSATWITDSAEGAMPLTVTVKSGGAIINGNGQTVTILEVLQHDSTLGATPDGGLSMLGGGTLTLAKANTYTGPTAVTTGTLLVTGSTAGGAVVVGASGILGGTGTVGGAVTVNGTIEPGSAAAIGTLTCSSTVALNGTTVMKLGPSSNDQLHSSLAAAGALAYGGALVVNNDGATLAEGDTFVLFPAASGSSYSGSFSSLTLPALGNGLAWQNNLSANGSISIISVSAPDITSVSQSTPGFLTFSGTGGTQGVTYRVVSTPSLVPPIVWTVVPGTSGTFGAGGSFGPISIPIAAGPPMFFAIQTP